MPQIHPPRRDWKPGIVWGLALIILVAGPGRALAETYEVINSVNLRQGPSDNTDSIRVLEVGERVEKIGAADGFLKVRTAEAKEGYVWAKYLKDVSDAAPPAFEATTPEFEKLIAAQKTPPPGRYFFESILEFLRLETHALFAILLPLFLAVAVGVASFVGLKGVAMRINQLVPDGLPSLGNRIVKWTVLVFGIYLAAEATGYFLDLALYSASLEHDTMLVMILSAPRLVLAAPAAVVDVLVRNWVVGIAFLLFLIMVVRSREEITHPRVEPATPAATSGRTAPLKDKSPSGASSPTIKPAGAESIPITGANLEFRECDTKIVAPPDSGPFPKMPESDSD